MAKLFVYPWVRDAWTYISWRTGFYAASGKDH